MHKIARPFRVAGKAVGGVCRRAGRALKPAAVFLAPIGRALAAAYGVVYKVSYITGVQTMRLFLATGRRIVKTTAPIGRAFCRLADFLFLRHIRSLAGSIAGESVRFVRGFPLAISRVRADFHENKLRGCRTAALLPYYAVRRHRRSLISLFNLAAPAAALVALVFTINHYSTLSFALAVEYNGDTIGYIADEAVYDAAANMAYGRVINTDNSFDVTRAPALTVKVVDKSELMDENAICNQILKSSSESIMNAAGLYIDGEFEAAVESREALDTVLSDILYSSVKTNDGDRVAFVQDVQIVEGLYPVTTVAPAELVKTSMTREVPAIAEVSTREAAATRPYLQVKVIRVVEKEESIPYEKVTSKNAKEYIGYKEVTTKGVNGVKKNTVEETLVDGKVVSSTILETVVTKKPVNEVTTIGDMKINSNSVVGDGKANGKFIWPIPGCPTVSSPFGSRRIGYHTGIDLCGGKGAMGSAVVAADGGKVIKAGWQSSNKRFGYGQYVLIDHGNGFQTAYAHLSVIGVKEGDKVTQGQQIGKAGNTGRSYGAHLHFEVRKNGTQVNPWPYIKDAKKY